MGHRSESKLCLSIVMKIDGLANRVSRQLQLQAYLLATSSLYPIATRAVASNSFVYFHGCLFATLVIIVCPLLRYLSIHLSLCVFFPPLLFAFTIITVVRRLRSNSHVSYSQRERAYIHIYIYIQVKYHR